MKATILANTPIKEEWLNELKTLVDWDITVAYTKEKLPSVMNVYFHAYWGDFNWVRKMITTGDIKCFCTTAALLRAAGIKDHIGMYDKADSDTKHDYYIGLPVKLDKRAKKNGFKYNFAWLVIHEYLHGAEKQGGGPDRVHSMEEQGRLKELLAEHQAKLQALTVQVTGLQKTVADLLAKFLPKRVENLQPLVKRTADELVSQMELLDMPIRITEGYRSSDRQDALYQQGRTTPGKIVTNAKAGESLHNYGVAFDVVFIKQGYNATVAQWETVGKLGEMLGLSWGGRWKFTDKPHFEMMLGYTLDDFIKNKVDYNKYK